MSGRLARAIALVAALAPAMAHAQTDIDQGKTPAQIFASDCAVCHKTVRGLATSRNRLTLTGFLSEHYTASREQAAALAAYVLGGGGESGSAAQGRGQKQVPEHAGAPAEEPKPVSRQVQRPAKPEQEAPATAKLQRPPGEEVKPEDHPRRAEESGPAGSARRSAAGRHDLGSATATQGRPKQPGAVPPLAVPAAVVAAPSSSWTPSQDASPTASPGPSAAAPIGAQPSEISPVARDNIPD